MKLSTLLLSLCLIVANADAEELLPPITQGQRVATCGHSFHVFTYKQVAKIAKSAGLDHQMVGLSSIGGSTVQKHWEVSEEKSAVKQVLKTGKVDVLTLSPIWLPDDAIEQFVKLGIEHNPALRILVQQYWMPNDEYNPVYPLDTKKRSITTPPTSPNSAMPRCAMRKTSKTTSRASISGWGSSPS